MKILIVQANQFLNGSGGTEKICSFLANGFVEMQHQVEIATNENISGKAIFPLHESIKVTNIYDASIRQKLPIPYFNYQGKNPFLWVKFKLKKKYSKVLNKLIYENKNRKDEFYEFNLRQKSIAWKKYIDTIKPDLIVTMTIGSLLEMSYQNNYNIPIIDSVNGRPDHDFTDVLWYRSEIDMRSLKQSYENLDGIQILFDSFKPFLPDTFKGKCVTIPNPIQQVESTEIVDHKIAKKRYKICNVGSLVMSHKQQNITIKVFTEIAEKYPDWDLCFWGIGHDYELIKDKIEKAKLENRIFLKGFTENPLEELKKSDIFIFPSRHEGFPLALGEALSAGLPSLGFRNCPGVNELIEHGKNGFLANDQSELKNNLEKLIQDNELRQKFGENAHLSMKKYAPETVLKQWEAFINNLVK